MVFKLKQNRNKLKAFTLAETLIAMVMVGILAAMVTPVIIGLTPSTNKVMFKKAYSTLESAVSNMINDSTNYPQGITGLDSSTTNTVVAGFNNEVTTTNTKSKFCYFLFDQLNTISGDSTSCPAIASSGTSSAVATSDGIIWYVYVPYADTTTFSTTYSASDSFPRNSTLYSTKVIVDVNGTTGPNCTADTYGATAPFAYGYSATCTNPDRFIIGVRYDGKLQIGCTTATGNTCSTATDSIAVSILSNPTTNN